MITFKDFIKKHNKRFRNSIELGSGNCNDSFWLSKQNVKIYAIDKKNCDFKKYRNFNFIKGDYFDIKNINKLNDPKGYDLIFSYCSLCFNSRKKIEKFLPLYIQKLSNNGIIHIIDFTPDDKIVTNRTNIYANWFFKIINKYFDYFEIKKEKVFESNHNHTHNIFELTCYNKKQF